MCSGTEPGAGSLAWHLTSPLLISSSRSFGWHLPHPESDHGPMMMAMVMMIMVVIMGMGRKLMMGRMVMMAVLVVMEWGVVVEVTVVSVPALPLSSFFFFIKSFKHYEKRGIAGIPHVSQLQHFPTPATPVLSVLCAVAAHALVCWSISKQISDAILVTRIHGLQSF